MAKRSTGGKRQNVTGTKAADTAAAEGLSVTADYRHDSAKRKNLPGEGEMPKKGRVKSAYAPTSTPCCGSTQRATVVEKVTDPSTGEWRHTKIVLKPLNPARDEIEIAEHEGDDGTRAVRVVAELVGIVA